MSMNETKIRIYIEDQATGKLLNIERGVGSLNRSLKSLSRGSGDLSNTFNRMAMTSPFEKINGDLSRTSNSFKEFNNVLNGTLNVWGRVIKEEIGRGLTSALGTAVASSFNLAKSIETNSVGIAGILASSYTLNDKQMEWNDALKVSRTIINDLSKDALATSASVGELVETFRALLGPAGQAGMSISQIEKLSVVGVNAVKSLGLGPDQYVQELRDLVQGGIRPSSSTLATSLGITDTDIKNAKNSSEGLYSFLMDKMKGFEIASQKSADTVQGAYDQITESVTYAIAEGQKKLYDYVRDSLNSAKQSIIYIDSKTQKVTLNPKLIEDTEKISDGFINIANGIKAVGEHGGLDILTKTFDALAGAFERLSKWVVPLLGYFALSKAKSVFNDVRNANESVTYKPKTAIGEIWQDKKDFLTGRRRRLNHVTDVANNFFEGFNEIDRRIQKEKELDSILENSRSSIRNLAGEWQNMGVNAQIAIQRAEKMKGVDVSNESGREKFDQLLRFYDKQAEYAETANGLFEKQSLILDAIVEKEKERETLEKRFETLFGRNIKTLGVEAHGKTREDKDEAFVTNFIGKKKNGVNAEYAQKYAEHLKKLGFEQNQVNEYTKQFIQTIKGLDKEKLADVFDKATKEAENYKEMLKSVRSGISPESFNINNFLSDKSNSKEQIESVKNLQKEIADGFNGIKLSTEEADKFVSGFVDDIKKLNPEDVYGINNAFKQASEGAKSYAKELESVKQASKIDIFINDDTNSAEQIESVKSLQEEISSGFDGIKLSVEETNKFVYEFVENIKKIDPNNVEELKMAFARAKNEAREYASQLQRVTQEERQEQSMSKLEELQSIALRNAFKVGGKKAEDAVKEVIKTHENLIKELKEVDSETEEVSNNEVKYLTRVANATKKLDTQMSAEQKQVVKSTQEGLKHKKSLQDNVDESGKLVGGIADLAFNLGILGGALADATGHGDSWEGELAEDVGEAGIFLQALDSIRKGIYETLIPALIDGINKLNEFGRALIANGFKDAVGGAIGGFGVAAGGTLLGIADYVVTETYGKWNAIRKGYAKNGEDFDKQVKDLFFGNVPKLDPHSVDSPEHMQADYEARAKNIPLSQRSTWIPKRINQIVAEEKKKENQNADTSKVKGNGNGNGNGNGGGGGSKRSNAKPQKQKQPKTIREMTQEVTYGYSVVQKAVEDMKKGITFGFNGCARFVSSLYEGYLSSSLVGGKGKGKGIIEQAGSAYHKYTGTQSLHAGDILVFDNGTGMPSHVGIYDGKGHSIASDSAHGKDHGIHEYDINKHPYGNIIGYISSDELTSGAKVTMQVTEEMQKQYEKSAEIEEKLNAVTGDYKEMFTEIQDISGEHNVFLETLAEGQEKIDKWQHDLAEVESLKDEKGNPLVDTEKYNNKIEEYKEKLRYYAIDKQRQQDEEDEEREINRLTLLQQLGYTDYEFQQAQLKREHEAYAKFLREELDDTQLSADRKADIEQKLADEINAINEIKRTDMHSFTEAVLADYEAMSINYADYAEDVIGTIESAGVSLISSFDTAHTKIKEFFSDVTKSILENMSKIIMKGLIMNAVFAVFNKETKNENVLSDWMPRLKDFRNIKDGESPFIFRDTFSSGLFGNNDTTFNIRSYIEDENSTFNIPHFANGGVADGLSLVGENGAELVDFKSPARVYSHNESKKLIGGGNVNVKLDIHNESGIPVTAEAQGTTFDGEQYVMSVVLKGIANNTMGSRTILKTLAQGG